MHECNICYCHKYGDICNYNHFICKDCKMILNTKSCIICNPYPKPTINNSRSFYRAWCSLLSTYGYVLYLYLAYLIGIVLFSLLGIIIYKIIDTVLNQSNFSYKTSITEFYIGTFISIVIYYIIL